MSYSFVDSHCHLDLILNQDGYKGTIKDLIQAAHDNQVNDLLCVSVNLRDFPAMLDLVRPYPNVNVSAGVHPNERDDDHEVTIKELIDLADDPNVIAIGETGLDYFRSEGDLTWQQDRFRHHIRAAIELKKPVIIHTRDAEADTLQIMKDEAIEKAGSILHCFTGTQAMADRALEMGSYISFSGIVTFKNAVELQAIAKTIPLDRMLIETDSPYLAPVPFRGKINQPAYVVHVAECIAGLRGISVEEVAKQTTKNYRELFGLEL